MIVLPDGRTGGRGRGEAILLRCRRQRANWRKEGRKGRTNRWPFSRKTITVIITRRSAAMTATAATARHSYVRHKYVPRLHGKEDAPRANAVKMPNEAGCVIMQKRSLEIPKICTCSLRI